VRNLEIGAQFSDSKNAQRNLEIAQHTHYLHEHTLRVAIINILVSVITCGETTKFKFPCSSITFTCTK